MFYIMFLFFFCLIAFVFIWGCMSSSIFEVCLDRCSLIFSDAFFMFDGVSFFCLLMLFLCGSVALIFCGHYFVGDLVGGSLLYTMLVVFLGVMGVLMTTYSMLGTLVMWEYLGVVSFFLILFYGNSDSLRATLITVFASRFGDVCLFGLIAFLWAWYGEGGLFFSLLILLVVTTKSACFPFISWLLEAMRAPTPVSSLVHSSTLVAAGVWFLFRYGKSVFIFSSDLEGLFFVLCIGSVFMSAFCSMVFLDLKKIVALSTCKNISWCMIFFLFGDIFLGVFQLLSHGVSKCFLFISLGDLMSSSSSAQDSRGVYCSGHSGVFSVALQCILVLSLSGVPFLGIFFSKHALLSGVLWGYKVFCCILLFVGFLLSYVYSFRLLALLCGFKSFGVYSFGSFFIITFVVSMVSGVFNVFCVGGVEELYSVGFFSGVLLLCVQLVGAGLGVWLYFGSFLYSFSVAGGFVWGCEALVSLFYYVFDRCYSMVLFLLYRWELAGLSFVFFRFDGLGLMLGVGWRSLKFLVLSGFCILGLCLILS